jgi:hypothetical protein
MAIIAVLLSALLGLTSAVLMPGQAMTLRPAPVVRFSSRSRLPSRCDRSIHMGAPRRPAGDAKGETAAQSQTVIVAVSRIVGLVGVTLLVSGALLGPVMSLIKTLLSLGQATPP